MRFDWLSGTMWAVWGMVIGWSVLWLYCVFRVYTGCGKSLCWLWVEGGYNILDTGTFHMVKFLLGGGGLLTLYPTDPFTLQMPSCLRVWSTSPPQRPPLFLHQLKARLVNKLFSSSYFFKQWGLFDKLLILILIFQKPTSPKILNRWSPGKVLLTITLRTLNPCHDHFKEFLISLIIILNLSIIIVIKLTGKSWHFDIFTSP